MNNSFRCTNAHTYRSDVEEGMFFSDAIVAQELCVAEKMHKDGGKLISAIQHAP